MVNKRWKYGFGFVAMKKKKKNLTFILTNEGSQVVIQFRIEMHHSKQSGPDQLAAVSTWYNRLGAHQVGAKKHIFLYEFENFFSQMFYIFYKNFI